MQNVRSPDVAKTQGAQRPKPGERRLQILQALATMLEQPGGERITTAALAAHLQVSEAALYRHFASKAQMFEALIDFIEQSVFGLLAQLGSDGQASTQRAGQMVNLLMKFAEKNRGMTRVMVGDALVFEHARLQQRMNLFFDKFEAALKQCLRDGLVDADTPTPTLAQQVRAATLAAFALGRLQRYVRSGFKREPTEQLELSLALLLHV
ncbi:MAG: nucleoid occlusion factor SlmA [Rhodoferax sp.]|jgi:TetR/AcrR family transcriptional regulator|uniref:nucleoid occlusion factor SlmA n=1 Tax=Rhodoferax sp. TaxID=50421 RepID=UPI001B5C1224|nr:nucleoid occlusion factor SlmA [Rhodoferax sp.]MBP8285693.1 nucleoid occlusion factor SlmA [Rhodoferax sp.]MBP9150004.1 nucleoid occlusion factor SlmA [Rhodoferax sp.]MBP9735549.1 nucleoid occlusion factor SlmA [Rhodoferax sp.]